MKTPVTRIGISIASALILCIILALSGALAVPSYADSAKINVTIEGRQVDFPADLGQPYVDTNSRTMVPLRAMANAIGCEVEWYQDSGIARFYRHFTTEDNTYTGATDQTAGREYVSDIEVLFEVGCNRCVRNWKYAYSDWTVEENDFYNLVDSNTTVMTTWTVNNNGRTYAPARYLAEAFGYDVDWDAATKTVILT